MTVTKIAGSTKRVRCAAPFKEIQAFYKANNTQSRLPKLVPTMIRAEVQGKLKSPRLRANAGKAKELIQCQLFIAQKFFDVDSTVEATMVQASQQHDCLSAKQWSTVHFLKAAQKFLLLFAALEAHYEQDRLFRVKPKAHRACKSRDQPCFHLELQGRVLWPLSVRNGPEERWKIFDEGCVEQCAVPVPGWQPNPEVVKKEGVCFAADFR